MRSWPGQSGPGESATAATGPTGGRRFLADAVLGGAGVAACVALLSSAFGWTQPPASADRPAATAIATLAPGSGSVRRRPEGALAWQLLRPGDGLAAGDTVYVPADTGARILFKDGAAMELQEAALVVIGHTLDATRRAPRLDLVQGTLAVRAPHRLVLGARGHRVLVDRGRARVQVSDGTARVSVADGRARLEGAGKSTDLGESEGGEITATGAVRSVPSTRIRLEAPPDGSSLALADGNVALTWQPAKSSRWLVEVAEDPEFRRLARRAEVRRPLLAVNLTPGVYHWRVTAVDSIEPMMSEPRTLRVVDPRALVVLRPSDRDEIDPTEETTFSWTALAGAERYRLEVGRDPAVQDVVLARETASNTLRERAALAAGQYWWRVGAALDGALAVWSEPKLLRVAPRGTP